LKALWGGYSTSEVGLGYLVPMRLRNRIVWLGSSIALGTGCIVLPLDEVNDNAKSAAAGSAKPAATSTGKPKPTSPVDGDAGAASPNETSESPSETAPEPTESLPVYTGAPSSNVGSPGNSFGAPGNSFGSPGGSSVATGRPPTPSPSQSAHVAPAPSTTTSTVSNLPPGTVLTQCTCGFPPGAYYYTEYEQPECASGYSYIEYCCVQDYCSYCPDNSIAWVGLCE
jgi:hypothetical protein